jgi:catechol 2,3-dioxygenase
VRASSETHRPTPAETTQLDDARYGAVHLDVIDLERSLGFWHELLGLKLLASDGRTAHLGVEDAELLVLHARAMRRPQRGHSGLYHVAIHLPSEAEFARVLGRLFNARYPNAPTDHIMHWATYLDDPDGIGLELSFETLDRFGGYEPGVPHPAVLDAEGRRRALTAPLDLDEVFTHLPGSDLDRPLAAGTRIGHIHLHVGDLEAALAFYEAVGFTRNVVLPIGMADMSAGGSFPHRLALNVWQGIGAPAALPGAAGLGAADLTLPTAEAVEAAVTRLRGLGAEVEPATAGGVSARDPAGNRVRLSAR